MFESRLIEHIFLQSNLHYDRQIQRVLDKAALTIRFCALLNVKLRL